MDLLERVPKSFLLSAAIYLAFQIVGSLLLFENNTTNSQNQTENINDEDPLIILKSDRNSLGVWYF